MKIIPANGGGPEMDGVFLSGYRDGDYTPRPRSGPLPSLPMSLREDMGLFLEGSSRMLNFRSDQ